MKFEEVLPAYRAGRTIRLPKRLNRDSEILMDPKYYTHSHFSEARLLADDWEIVPSIRTGTFAEAMEAAAKGARVRPKNACEWLEFSEKPVGHFNTVIDESVLIWKNALNTGITFLFKAWLTATWEIEE